MGDMAALLWSAGLAVTVGRYSISIDGDSRYIFQQYGGDLGDPVINADAESVSELLVISRLVSEVLAQVRVRHRFE